MRRLLAVAALALTVTGTAGAVLAAPPNDQYLARQWYLGRDHALDTFDAAKQLFTVRVAVIDSGVDLGHPELKSRIVAHRSFVGGTVADTLGHGTFVAGEIAAAPDNAVGIAGIAFPAQLLIAKVVDANGELPLDAEVAAIKWAVDQGARVITAEVPLPREVLVVRRRGQHGTRRSGDGQGERSDGQQAPHADTTVSTGERPGAKPLPATTRAR